MGDVTITATTADEMSGPDDIERTRVTFAWNDKSYLGRLGPYQIGRSGIWGVDRKPWSDFAGGSHQEIRTDTASGEAVANIDGLNSGMQRPRYDADFLDSEIIFDTCALPIERGGSPMLSVDGDTTLDGWLWPAATHLRIYQRDAYSLQCDQAPLSQFSAIDCIQRYENTDREIRPTELIFGDTHGSNVILRANTTHRVDQDGNWYRTIRNTNNGSEFATRRTAVWGLPPTARIFFQTSGFFTPSPGDMTAIVKLTYLSLVDGQTSSEEILRQTVSPTNPFSNWRLWTLVNSSLSLASATLPTWADVVTISGESDAGDPLGWDADYTMMPYAPDFADFAQVHPRTPYYVPGIMRDVTP